MPTFSIIVVNWNTCELLRNCLHSVRQHTTNSSFEIIVVDNASKDNSCQMLTQEFPNVRLIANSVNVGFSRGNNQAIAQSQGKYMLLLNPDTEFINDVLHIVETKFRQCDDIGIIGTKLLTPTGHPQSWVRGYMISLRTAFNHYLFLSSIFSNWQFFKGIVDNNEYPDPISVDWVSGACLAVRTSTVKQVGALDESIFMYNEDMELCYRVKKAGFQVMYVPTAKVTHWIGQSLQQQTDATVLVAPLYSQDQFYQRLYNRRNLTLFRLIVWVGTLFRLGLRLLGQTFGYGHQHKIIEARRNANIALELLLGKLDE